MLARFAEVFRFIATMLSQVRYWRSGDWVLRILLTEMYVMLETMIEMTEAIMPSTSKNFTKPSLIHETRNLRFSGKRLGNCEKSNGKVIKNQLAAMSTRKALNISTGLTIFLLPRISFRRGGIAPNRSTP